MQNHRPRNVHTTRQRIFLRLLAFCLLPSTFQLLPSTLLGQGTTTRPTTTAGTGTNNNNNNANRTNTNNGTSNSSNAGTTRQYRNATQLGDALIQIDPETRSLIIVADEDTEKEITAVLKNLDRPKPQVLIKVLFAQVTLDDSTDFGVEGGYAFNVGQPALTQLGTSALQAITGSPTAAATPSSTTTTTNNNGTVSSTTTTTSTYPQGTSGYAGPGTNFGLSGQNTGAFFKLNTQNATATLYALATKGKVSVLSRPSILARNNQQAVIVVGQEVPIPTSNTISDTGSQIQSVSYQDVGIILRVTPFITTSKTVEMIVSPEISSLSSQMVQISTSFSAPVINKTSAETVVVTPDQTTVVIGGLMQKQVSANVSKVPLLGDIPFVGNAFKRTTKSTSKTELLIFLTPYIVEGTDKLDDLTVDQVNRTDLPQQAFQSQKDVSQYLDSALSLMPQTQAQVRADSRPRRQTDRDDHEAHGQKDDDHHGEADGQPVKRWMALSERHWSRLRRSRLIFQTPAAWSVTNAARRAPFTTELAYPLRTNAGGVVKTVLPMGSGDTPPGRLRASFPACGARVRRPAGNTGSGDRPPS